jgi:phospholipid-binding lipoprotein MlaA
MSLNHLPLNCVGKESCFSDIVPYLTDRKSGMKTKSCFTKFCQQAIVAGSALLLAACATTKDNVDPYEHYNRAVFKFNRSLDYVIMRPVADLYDTLTPAPVQGGIGRMYTNFYEPSRVINDILQGEGRYAYQDGARFLLNSTVGIVGFFDVAQQVGFPLHQQDFGITMARWGWTQSAYFVAPFIGIYTFRDLVAVPFNTYVFTFWPYIQPENVAWTLYIVEKSHTRAVLRPADKVIDEAFDPYIFVRDAFLQKRNQDIKTQQTGRSTVVKPAPEQAEDQTKSTVAESTAVSVKEGEVAQKASKRSSGKNLPDVLSLQKSSTQTFVRRAEKQESEGSDTEVSEIIG